MVGEDLCHLLIQPGPPPLEVGAQHPNRVVGVAVQTDQRLLEWALALRHRFTKVLKGVLNRLQTAESHFTGLAAIDRERDLRRPVVASREYRHQLSGPV